MILIELFQLGRNIRFLLNLQKDIAKNLALAAQSLTMQRLQTLAAINQKVEVVHQLRLQLI